MKIDKGSSGRKGLKYETERKKEDDYTGEVRLRRRSLRKKGRSRRRR